MTLLKGDVQEFTSCTTYHQGWSQPKPNVVQYIPFGRLHRIMSITASRGIFISYSHYNRDLLVSSHNPDEPTRFIRALQPLESIGARILFDAELKAGDLIDSRLMTLLKQADLLLIIVSDDFLHSAYCLNVEVAEFLSRKGIAGRIVPFYYSSCNWRSVEWLSRRKMIPDPRYPFLSIQDEDRRERVLVELRQTLHAHLDEIEKEST